MAAYPLVYPPPLSSTTVVGVPGQPQPGQMGGAGAGYEELTPLVMQLSEPDKVNKLNASEAVLGNGMG